MSLHYNKSKSAKILRPGKDKDGYLQVQLCKNGIHKMMKIHRLVALHFLPNPKNFKQVNHKNEIKTCNEFWNLEWCDNLYNNNYGHKNDWNKKPVIQLDLSGNYIREFDSIIEAARSINKSHSHISQCVVGKRNMAYGYRWKLK